MILTYSTWSKKATGGNVTSSTRRRDRKKRSNSSMGASTVFYRSTGRMHANTSWGRITRTQGKSGAEIPEDSGISTGIKSNNDTAPEGEGQSPAGTPREEKKRTPAFVLGKCDQGACGVTSTLLTRNLPKIKSQPNKHR